MARWWVTMQRHETYGQYVEAASEEEARGASNPIWYGTLLDIYDDERYEVQAADPPDLGEDPNEQT
jgi:hypothetical protein